MLIYAKILQKYFFMIVVKNSKYMKMIELTGHFTIEINNDRINIPMSSCKNFQKS